MKEKTLQTNTRLSLGFLAIFLLGLFIRVYGSAKINFTEFEAAYVLGIEEFVSYTPSILQNLANKFLMQLPDYSPPAFRLLSIFAGSLIILLPYLMRQKLGYWTALVCAFFFAFDPFLIADSILITGNTFVLLAAGLLFVAWMHEKYDLIPLFLFSMMMMGRGFAYFVITINAFLLITSNYPAFLAGFRSGLSKLESKLSDREKIIFAALILVIIFLISSTRLDILVADLSAFFMNLRANYPPGNSPFLYPLALLVYIPLGIVLAILSLFFGPLLLKRVVKLALIGGGISFFLVSVFPGHRVIDLVWVSIPIWVVSAIGFTHFFDSIKPRFKSSLVFITVLLVSMGNLMLSFLSLTYRYRFGLALVDNLVAIFTIQAFAITVLIYWAYLHDIKTALGGLGTTLFILLLLFQLSVASHTAGLSGSPEREIFWDGYYPDKPLIDNLIKTSIGNQMGTLAPVDIWGDRDINPEIYWDLKISQMTKQIANEGPTREYFAIFKSSEEPVDLSALYIGQKFVAKSYPTWMISPLRSLMGNDFWSWLFIRDTQQVQEYNYLWLSVGNNP